MRSYLLRFSPYIGYGFFLSLFINVLQLAYLLYMRLLFDKVMTSRSTETLFYLTAGVIGAYVVMGLLEVVRSKLLVRVGIKFDQVVGGEIFRRMVESSVMPGSVKHTQGLKDLNRIRNFLGGVGIFAFFDTPWVPIYLAIIFAFHPLLGLISCAGGALLLLLVVIQEILTGRMQSAYLESSLTTNQFLNSTLRNVQSVYAMGMLPALTRRWKGHNSRDVLLEDRLAARNGFFPSMAKLVQMVTVVLIMSVGAYLVIIHEATIGTMIAASMIMGRALAPILMLGNAWKSLVEFRIAYKRLDRLMETTDGKTPTLPPGPRAEPLIVEDVSYSIQGVPILRGVNLTVEPGASLAVVGASGAGKSTLARILLGLWPPDTGCVRLGERNIQELDPEGLGRRTGYMPQEVELFSATVAENIARFNEPDSLSVVEKAKEAGAHQMILRLPQGYDTPIGQGGVNLSGGQKQFIALARAIYGDPWMVVMDEPDSHLDQSGREALREVFASLERRGISVVIISHNQAVAEMADRTLVLDQGALIRDSVAEGEGRRPIEGKG